uniref:PRKG1_interact domain-containing protein n=1 Tax=Panagrellus redivivus TaxID=6233 RepID=A0A7E4W6Z4_PANRE
MASNRRSPSLSHRLTMMGPSTSSAAGAAYSFLKSVSPSPLERHGFGRRSPPASPGCLSSTARSYLSAPYYQPPSRTRSLVNRISSRVAHSEVLRHLPPVEPIKTLGEKDRERYLSELPAKNAAAAAARRASDVGPAITVESELEEDYEDEDEYEDEEEEADAVEPLPTVSAPSASKKPYWMSQSVEEEPEDEEYEDEEEDEFADEEDFDIEPDEDYDELYEADETDDIAEDDEPTSSNSVSAAFVLKLPPDKASTQSPNRVIPPPRIYIDQIPSASSTPERNLYNKPPPFVTARNLHDREQTPAPLTFSRPVAPPVPPKPTPSPVYSARNMTPPMGSSLTADETDDLLDDESDWEDEEWEDEEEEEFSDPEDAKAFRLVTELIQKYQETQYQNGPFGPVSASTRTFSSGVATISTHNGQNGTASGPDRYKMLYEKEREENERLRRKLEESGHHDAQQNGSTRSTVAPSRSQSISEDAEKRALERRIAQLEYELEHANRQIGETARIKTENEALIRVLTKLSRQDRPPPPRKPNNYNLTTNA